VSRIAFVVEQILPRANGPTFSAPESDGALCEHAEGVRRKRALFAHGVGRALGMRVVRSVGERREALVEMAKNHGYDHRSFLLKMRSQLVLHGSTVVPAANICLPTQCVRADAPLIRSGTLLANVASSIAKNAISA
jgi:hypothetical protein